MDNLHLNLFQETGEPYSSGESDYIPTESSFDDENYYE